MFNVYVSGLTVLVVFRFLVHLTLNGNNEGTKGGGSKEKKNGNLTRKIYIGGKVNGVVTCEKFFCFQETILPQFARMDHHTIDATVIRNYL